MHEVLRRLAAGHLIQAAKAAEQIDLRNMDGVVARVVKDLSILVVTQPHNWPHGSGISVRTIVVQELERLIRRGRLALVLNRFNTLVLEPREEVLCQVSRIS